MHWPTICAAVIPCHNEGDSVGDLVNAIRRYLPSIFVVDDGSSDQTATRAAGAGARVIRHPCNPGKGAALKSGAQAAAAAHCSWMLTMDGDGQHRPEDIPAFLRCAEETQASVIVGNRMHEPREMPWLRRTVNRWMSRRISACAGASLPDTQSGFRLVDLAAWNRVPPQTDHFEIESEMLLAFVRARLRIEFVPISVVGRGGHSHIQPVRDSLRWLRWWWRARTAAQEREAGRLRALDRAGRRTKS